MRQWDLSSEKFNKRTSGILITVLQFKVLLFSWTVCIEFGIVKGFCRREYMKKTTENPNSQRKTISLDAINSSSYHKRAIIARKSKFLQSRRVVRLAINFLATLITPSGYQPPAMSLTVLSTALAVITRRRNAIFYNKTRRESPNSTYLPAKIARNVFLWFGSHLAGFACVLKTRKKIYIPPAG